MVKYTLESKKARAKIGGLLRSKKNPYVRHTENTAKKKVEQMRKDIKKLTGMTQTEYKDWMASELKKRKAMGMTWSDYDLVLQAKINKAKLVAGRIQERLDTGQYIDKRLYKSIDNSHFFSKKSVFTPEVSNSAFFSLPNTYESSIKDNGRDNYTSYIILRELRSGQTADSMVYRHTMSLFDRDNNRLTVPVRAQEDGTTAVVMTKASVYRENYYKALYSSLASIGPDGLQLFNKLKIAFDLLDDFEFESVAAFVPITYIYDEIQVRAKYTQVYNEIISEIEHINAKKERGK